MRNFRNRKRSAHLLLATLIAGPLDTGLPFFLVLVSGAVVIAIYAVGTIDHDAAGAALPLSAAIGGEALAADGHRTCWT